MILTLQKLSEDTVIKDLSRKGLSESHSVCSGNFVSIKLRIGNLVGFLLPLKKILEDCLCLISIIFIPSLPEG